MRLILVASLIVATAGADTLQEARWHRASVPPHYVPLVARTVDRILTHRARYEAVDRTTRVPWYVIAGLHNMESSGSFRHHLHEGSPLSGRTRWIPKGRPKTGAPPFTWETSAVDALLYDHLDRVDWRSLDATLYACERYNGTGYLRYHPDVPTPYLWAKTTLERPGKYIADGRWSSTARSKQIGIAALWKTMEARGILDFDRLK